MSRAFTLIELLVVLAIIGMLASVILASVSAARSKGADAAVKSNLSSMRTQAEIVRSNNTSNCYSVGACTNFTKTTCTNTASTLFADSTIWGQISSAISAGGGLSSCVVAGTTATVYAVAVQLKSDTTKAWCVDSNGASREVSISGGISTAISAANVCN